MQLLDVLMREHRVILDILDILEQLADQGAVEKTLDWEMAQEIVDVLREFADRGHHGKEEGVLFPLLAARGLSRQYGRLGVMVYEHNQGRRHLRQMSQAVEEAAAGAPGTLARRAGAEQRTPAERFLDHARAYLELMRRHIRKEDHCLFPWLERNLTPEERQALDRAFAVAKQFQAAAGLSEHLLAAARRLIGRLDKPSSAEDSCPIR